MCVTALLYLRSTRGYIIIIFSSVDDEEELYDIGRMMVCWRHQRLLPRGGSTPRCAVVVRRTVRLVARQQGGAAAGFRRRRRHRHRRHPSPRRQCCAGCRADAAGGAKSWPEGKRPKYTASSTRRLRRTPPKC